MKQTVRKKISRGFTLVELLVVLAISMVLMTALIAGATSLQGTVSLDDTLRQIKTEIQATQNIARNSLFSNYSASASNYLQDKRISLGWIITLSSNPAQQSIAVVKRSVYAVLPSQYDYSSLRKDIILIRQSLVGKDFACGSLYNNELRLGSGQGANITYPNLSNVKIYCTEDSQFTKNSGRGAAEFIGPTIFGKAVLSDQSSLPSTALSLCYTGSSQVDIFFTSGYGEPAVAKFASSGCQIRINNKLYITNSYRSLKFDTQSGGVTTCGSYCP